MIKKIRWGILGCAGIAKRALIPAIQQTQHGVLYGIASRDKSKSREWVKEFGIEKAYDNYQALLNDPEIDAVYIPLPNHLHNEWTCKAAKASKHVLCEKPFALNMTEVKEMILATDIHDVYLMEAFMYRFHPQHEKVMNLIEKGEIGDIRAFHSSFTFMYANPGDNYRLNKEMGGGALLDVGCYCINAARMIFGEEPISVYATAHLDKITGIDLSCSILLEFPNHRTAQLDGSFESQFQNYYEVVGTKGKIIAKRAYIPKMNPGIIEVTKGDNIKVITIPPINQYVLMLDHFHDCIRKDHLPRFPADDALYNTRVIHAVQKSYQTERAIKLPKVDMEV